MGKPGVFENSDFKFIFCLFSALFTGLIIPRVRIIKHGFGVDTLMPILKRTIFMPFEKEN